MKTAVVTGGTKGIGLAIVRNLLSRGYKVFTNYRSDDYEASKVHNSLREFGNNLYIKKADQADYSEFNKFIELVKSESDSVDCIVCNAGLTVRKPTFDISNDEWRNVFEVAVNSHFFLIRDLHDMIPDNSRIIFIGSMMGVLPHGTSLPYGVSKSAVHAMAKNLVKDFAGTGTTVNAIAPGFVDTEWQKNKPQDIRNNIINKTASGRFASPVEISSAVNFCLDNSFVNGSIIEVSGGYCFK